MSSDTYRNTYCNVTHYLNTAAGKFSILILLSNKGNRYDMTAKMMIC
jgi:hypothetical protein